MDMIEIKVYLFGFVSGPCLFKDTMQLSSYIKIVIKSKNIRKINEDYQILSLKI